MPDHLLTNKAEAIRYVDVHYDDLPEDAPPELRDSYSALLAPLLLNSALAAVKLGGSHNSQTAINSASRALEYLELSNADQGGCREGTCWRNNPNLFVTAKAL